MNFEHIEKGLVAVGENRPIVLLDDSRPEVSAHLLMAGEAATEEVVNFMAVHCLGVICVGIPAARADALGLTPMPGAQDSEDCAGFTISVEARERVSTGISAADRSETILVLADSLAVPSSLVSPGHIFPIRVERGGVLHKSRPAEASVEVARLAGKEPVGAFCTILDSKGEVRDEPGGLAFAKEHGLETIRITDLVRYRLNKEFIVRRVGESQVETPHGAFTLIIYENELDGSTHPVFVKGKVLEVKAPVARIHSQCLTGDAFHSLRCDCGDQLQGALELIESEGSGVLVYLRQEGRGIGLVNKVRAYGLQDQGRDTVDANLALGFGADERSYVLAAQIFKDLGLSEVKLITNNQRKVKETEDWGIVVQERIALPVALRPENEVYLRTKQERLGHLLSL